MSSEPSDFRASDSDRERVAAVLHKALREGRITLAEFDQRLADLYLTRTYGELTPLTADLPDTGHGDATTTEPALAHPTEGTVSTKTSSWTAAILSAARREGPWIVPARFSTIAFWGGGKIDLREARFTQQPVEIRCYALMGGIEVIVPPGVDVEVRGVGIMGGFDRKGRTPPRRGPTQVIVRGMALWGGVLVRHEEPDKD